MYNPVATYRIQFHKGFTLADFRNIIPYLSRLGVRTIYASPISEAEKGSTHGYDQVNPLRVNPEIGTLEELETLHAALKEKGIGWLQDIVPNHMAYTPANKWLMDVLEKGQASPYAGYFDILWQGSDTRLMAPFLGDTLENVIEKKELQLIRHEGRWAVQYYQAVFPLNEPSIRSYDEQTLARAHEYPPLLQELLAQQHYRLCHWQETNSRINYRRFFTVNSLICLNAQDEKVFEATHAFAFSMLQKGIFNGLRVDHIDGLFNPEQYLLRLREKAGSDVYLIVEKILETGEALPVTWPVQGTSGYGFLAQVNNLLTCPESRGRFTRFYTRLTGHQQKVATYLSGKKHWMLYNRMQGELDNLTHWFLELDPDLDFKPAKKAIAHLLTAMPQYRFYGNQLPLSLDEWAAMRQLFTQIKEETPEIKKAVNLLEDALLRQPLAGHEAFNQKALYFYQRLMQLSGPLMAKGMEDTLMYTYNRFIGHNEVGDSPENFGMPAADFHEAMLDRRKHWPLALNATATHDTKRGEDARALLNVLTAIPDAWLEAVNSWRDMNAALKKMNAPDANEEYFIYQTLFASWPLLPEAEAAYPERLKTYLQKALREAKLHTEWAEPDAAYEAAVQDFALRLLDRQYPFFTHFRSFRNRYQDFGMVNGLTQVLLKCTCPGVPDVYQGTELWDQDFVDPDNRRPVDYELRLQMLETTSSRHWTELWDERLNGSIKLRLLQELLLLRSAHTDLFEKGSYLPLKTSGAHAAHIFAFARKYEGQWLLVVGGLHLPLITDEVTVIDWQDTRMQLPPGLAAAWQQEEGAPPLNNREVEVRHLLQPLPVFYKVISQPDQERGAGILAAVSSLPGSFGMGDFGPEAYRFTEMLGAHGWQYWQLLPLGPVSAGSSYSPYSSFATFAGNPLFISPQLLARDGLLAKAEWTRHQLPATAKIDYAQTEKSRNSLLEIAWQRYRQNNFSELKSRVAAFRQEEAWWLDDFALYCALKQHFKGKPWYEWPQEFRQRKESVLQHFAAEHSETIACFKWQQALFAFQLRDFRIACQQNGIQLIGDLPFYASYDAADVWSHQELFSVDEQGRMTGVAGVPPDYFSETGQLWGMPTFRWEAMKADGYQWWIRRLKKNLEYCDLLRIDHFRALVTYWEVPAGEQTATHGKWMEGPGMAFFEAVQQALGKLPFIAEDLGDQMTEVYKLRDKAGLPGMAVLQFAFGKDLPTTIHAPHNYRKNTVVYTGTHDNNTILGWYRCDASAADKQRLQEYAGRKITEANLPEVIGRLALASVARLAIMPLQDVLGLDEKSRMNRPGTSEGNWTWRLKSLPASGRLKALGQIAALYGRY